ncbi:MAG: hypothetical protein GVY23_07455 [Spirochaetes bacterium]|nr:hypothetical protein [Spirochaetota bacterium]
MIAFQLTIWNWMISPISLAFRAWKSSTKECSRRNRRHAVGLLKTSPGPIRSSRSAWEPRRRDADFADKPERRLEQRPDSIEDLASQVLSAHVRSRWV